MCCKDNKQEKSKEIYIVFNLHFVVPTTKQKLDNIKLLQEQCKNLKKPVSMDESCQFKGIKLLFPIDT